MICPICRHGNIISGNTTITFEKGNTTIVLKKVPAEVCDNCQESFISEKISKNILKIVEAEVKKGIEIEILNYAA